MTQYIVHIYREMRLTFVGIEAETLEVAAMIAAGKPTEDAAAIEDCDGENLAALVDVVGDEAFEHSVTIDFAPERLRKAGPALLEALVNLMAQIEGVYDDSDVREANTAITLVREGVTP